VKRAGLAYTAALLVDLVGAAGALLIGLRTWQTVTTPRPAPLHPDVLALTGRTVDAAPTALGLVALAGIVAVLATKGLVRRVVGAVLALAGAALVWRAFASAAAIGTARARLLVTERHSTVDADSVVPRVAVQGAWPVLTAVCGVLVLVAGLLIAWRGHRWSVMSARYEARSADGAGESAQPAAATLWTALDRGEDPTR
jgi:uncharacterized membrane protein (TIGR02234 family)